MKRLTTFEELAQVISDLPLIVINTRRARRLSLREAAEQAGVGFTTLSRIENGNDCSASSLRSLLLWLDEPATVAVEEGTTP